jgi:methionyl-tRNA formyltransferase
MRFALFAADRVGFEITRLFSEKKEPLSCLVVDSNDPNNFNDQIITDYRSAGGRVVIPSDAVYESDNIKVLKTLDLDLIILAWWPYIIQNDLIRLPRIGCLNFHPSYLPYNRGKHYNFWSIVENVPFGVTIHWVTEEIDAGDIAFQTVIQTSWEDTGETLYHAAQREIIKLFTNNFTAIKQGRIPKIPQDLTQGSFHFANEIEEASKIDLNLDYQARHILNLMRARTFPPYPGVRFTEDGKTFEVRIQITEVGKDN